MPHLPWIAPLEPCHAPPLWQISAKSFLGASAALWSSITRVERALQKRREPANEFPVVRRLHSRSCIKQYAKIVKEIWMETLLFFMQNFKPRETWMSSSDACESANKTPGCRTYLSELLNWKLGMDFNFAAVLSKVRRWEPPNMNSCIEFEVHQLQGKTRKGSERSGNGRLQMERDCRMTLQTSCFCEPRLRGWKDSLLQGIIQHGGKNPAVQKRSGGQRIRVRLNNPKTEGSHPDATSFWGATKWKRIRWKI